MNLTQFNQYLDGKTKNELIRMRNNAEKKERQDCVEAAELELDKRFPDWKEPSKRGRARPTEVMFRGEKRVVRRQLLCPVGDN